MPHRATFTLHLSTALGRPVGRPSSHVTRDEARAAVRYAFTQAIWGLGEAPHHAVISHPDGTRESMEFGRVRLGRRERLLAFAEAFCRAGGNHGGRFTLRAGFAYADLTDAALERLRAAMLRAYWSQKRSSRESRAHHARQIGRGTMGQAA